MYKFTPKTGTAIQAKFLQVLIFLTFPHYKLDQTAAAHRVEGSFKALEIFLNQTP